MSRVRSIPAVLALLAVAIWLGGLLALGAIAAPVVFSVVPAPSSADAMTIVFRRFDLVAMACAALVLSVEATRALAREPFGVSDHLRVAASALAGALAVLEGAFVSPRIAALHWAGAVRGLGTAGIELARLHNVAEACGKAQAGLLVAIVALQVVALRAPPVQPARLSSPG
ncbi:MAG TPA: DUF4149 domain-containing protein [Polyangiaceae bacterium]|nr:DUF4149 domain-containing protein [Polyangiaceae bacterium]